MRRQGKERTTVILSVIFFICGLLVVIISIKIFIAGYVDSKKNVRVIGTIVAIDDYGDGHEVYVSYKYKDKTYEFVELNRYVFTMKVGDRVNVSVNPADPSRVSGAGADMSISAIMGLGGLIFVITSLVLCRPRKQDMNS